MPAIDRDALRERVTSSFVGRCVTTFVDQRGVDRSMVIASQAFTALIPLLILVSALAPTSQRDVVGDAIVHKLHLSGQGATAVRQVFTSSSNASVGVLSVLLLLFSGVSLTRRWQRMYLDAWHLDLPRGIRGPMGATFGLAALLVEVALLTIVQSLIKQLPGQWVLGAPLSLLAGVVLWTSIPWLLLDRQLHWRRLLPAGALTAVCTSAYGVATMIYMPAVIDTYSRRYGLFGVTLALVGWLLVVSMIVVAAAIVAAELDRASEPWARRLRESLGVETEGVPATSHEAGGPEPSPRPDR